MVATTKTNDSYNQRRKKLWQIPGTYHCSVMGICFGRRELRKFKAKRSFEFSRNHSDYYVHNRLSSIAAQKSQQSRLLHKELDTMYRLAVKRYAPFQTEEEMLAQWEQDYSEGSIADSYWAIMTHPATNKTVIDRIYGDCHMASYDYFNEQRREAAILRKYREENTQLKKQLIQKTGELAALKEKRSTELGALKQERSALIRQKIENERLREQNRKLQEKLAGEAANAELDALKAELAERETLGASLQQQVADMKAELTDLNESHELLEEMVVEKDEKLKAVKSQNYEQQVELTTMEKMVMERCPEQGDCESCEEDCSCPINNSLGGKTVLYVGGQRKMISHYRQIIEDCGGEFLYHDGGRESSRHQLPKMLSGADAVFCPIDCVSHDACKCVKKICKRYQKTFVMMRSSGLSSLAKGLETIGQ